MGVLLYELLIGKTPFDGKELVSMGIDAMRKTIRESEPARPSTRLATLLGEELTSTATRRSSEISTLAHLLKGDLDWIVMKCLEKDRQRRYETANAVAADIKRHLGNEPIVARPPSAIYKFQKAWRRNKLVYSSGAAVLLALLLGIGFSFYHMSIAIKASNEAKKAKLEKENEAIAAQEERDKAKEAKAEAIQNEKTARQLLYSANINLAAQALQNNNLDRARELLNLESPGDETNDLKNWEWRYLWAETRDDPSFQILDERPVRASEVSFSPSGEYLAVSWTGKRLDLWDVATKTKLRSLISDQNSMGLTHAQFSPKDPILAYALESKDDSNGRTVSALNCVTGELSILWESAEPGKWFVHHLAFSSDGSRIAISISRETNPRNSQFSVQII